jgi:hypothetical protein
MGKPDNLESVKTSIKDGAQALVEQQSFLNAFEDAIKRPFLPFVGAQPQRVCSGNPIITAEVDRDGRDSF